MVDVSDESINLPPGFRFHPTDEEIITHYLSEKVLNSSFSARAIGEVDLNKCEPWDLPKRARMGEKEWYFFCQRDRKYPTGTRTNRATEAGYWKATGKDREIYKGRGCLVGMKKTLVFYRGRAPKGEKTNWVMHEYRLEGKSYHNLPKSAKDVWSVCRVLHKSSGVEKSPLISGLLGMISYGNGFVDSPSLPSLLEPPCFMNTSKPIDNNNNDDNKFNGMTSSSSTTTTATSLMRTLNGNQFYYSTNIDGGNINDHQHDNKSFVLHNKDTMITNNTFSSRNYYPQIPFSNHHQQQRHHVSFSHPDVTNSVLSNADQQESFRAPAAIYAPYDSKMRCKVEQLSSNQSMVSFSQDTGISANKNTEIPSVTSKHDMGGNMPCEDFEGLSSVDQFVDLECLWNF